MSDTWAESNKMANKRIMKDFVIGLAFVYSIVMVIFIITALIFMAFGGVVCTST